LAGAELRREVRGWLGWPDRCVYRRFRPRRRMKRTQPSSDIDKMSTGSPRHLSLISTS